MSGFFELIKSCYNYCTSILLGSVANELITKIDRIDSTVVNPAVKDDLISSIMADNPSKLVEQITNGSMPQEIKDDLMSSIMAAPRTQTVEPDLIPPTLDLETPAPASNVTEINIPITDMLAAFAMGGSVERIERIEPTVFDEYDNEFRTSIETVCTKPTPTTISWNEYPYELLNYDPETGTETFDEIRPYSPPVITSEPDDADADDVNADISPSDFPTLIPSGQYRVRRGYYPVRPCREYLPNWHHSFAYIYQKIRIRSYIRRCRRAVEFGRSHQDYRHQLHKELLMTVHVAN
jgi:hypothetical protein